ncbi:hypothetical protein ABEB36_015166 [Hypothenemus hampei]|uniref:DDE Tnp4 domain-containing protein n=1 Tax=Hypothenemus hampei TaxID=57062 RepID=A0ABD1E3C0_HYPHA
MSDHFSSSDEDLDNIMEVLLVPKTEDYFEEIVPQFNNHQYLSHFRISRAKTEELANQFSVFPYYNIQEGNSQKVTPLKFVTVFLWYAANEAVGYRDVADRFNISESTLYKILRRCTYFFSNMSPEVIKWPNEEEKIEIERFFSNKNFPGVIGVIDGTHIRIDKPADDPDSYLNRKHFYSIQAQIVCDHKKKIRDIFVGYPGSVHDSRVLRTSPLFASLDEKCNDKFILGDSGYPCLRNLLTPFKDNGRLNRRERNYNYILSTNRYIVEHCFGLWKQKFRQLYHIKWHKIEDIVHFIRACAVLHNLALDYDFDEDTPTVEDDVAQPILALDEDQEPERDDQDGLVVRNAVKDNLNLII